MRMRSFVVLVAVAVGCGASDQPSGGAAKSPATTPPAPAAAAPVAGGRILSADGRGAMKDHLVAETTGKKAWILSQPGDPEVAALASSLAGVFREAGWTVSIENVTGISLKPGIMTLIAEEQYPSYVDTVLKALDASGLDAKSASGYRGYYEAKKQENPKWPGVPLRQDQDFVIVVGPKPQG
jgi:hypothetical protein